MSAEAIARGAVRNGDAQYIVGERLSQRRKGFGGPRAGGSPV
jgi:hypothetical protein